MKIKITFIRALTLKNRYTFYKYSERKRISLVGSCFVEAEHDPRYQTIYFPIGLVNRWTNYGKQQGLVFVSPIWDNFGSPFFRVGVCSPDDLDCDLDFGANYGKESDLLLRNQVVEYLHQMNKTRISYDTVLNRIQRYFGAGKRTS